MAKIWVNTKTGNCNCVFDLPDKYYLLNETSTKSYKKRIYVGIKNGKMKGL